MRHKLNPESEISISKAILAGNTRAWARITTRVMKSIGSWKDNPNIDHELAVSEAILKAANTYLPKRKFVNHATHIAINTMRNAYRKSKAKSRGVSCSISAAYGIPERTSSNLDKMIAIETVEGMIHIMGSVGDMARLLREGKIAVVGAVYDVETGEVSWLGPHLRQAALVKEGGAEESSDQSSSGAPAHATSAH